MNALIYSSTPSALESLSEKKANVSLKVDWFISEND